MNDYLDKLVQERNRINEEADEKIDMINSQRDRLLQYNYEKQQEFLNRGKQK